ncbi:MAG: IS21-like element helper ATPase IstB [Candidatus Cloacimonadaceae bacterium]|jgi:DNA replication protein DnaC|nr:IS21-like element helper ATPase IstB [Candidatus Cloacimonadota bacterium]
MISELQQGLRSIRCYHMANALGDILHQSKENDVSYVEFLSKLIDREKEDRNRTRIKQQCRKAKLPCEKLLECFDFNYQTSITKRQVQGWLDFDWIDNRENKLLLGPSGVGKTHLAIGVSHEALQKGYKVKYFSMVEFVEEMIIKEASGLSKEWVKDLLKNDLIVLDELGYLPVDQRYTHLFFNFINACYEYRSVLITSNKMPTQWGSYFGDESVAMAILDRLMHHSEIVILNGDSYRLKDKLAVISKASEKFSDGIFPLRSKVPSETTRK